MAVTIWNWFGITRISTAQGAVKAQVEAMNQVIVPAKRYIDYSWQRIWGLMRYLLKEPNTIHDVDPKVLRALYYMRYGDRQEVDTSSFSEPDLVRIVFAALISYSSNLSDTRTEDTEVLGPAELKASIEDLESRCATEFAELIDACELIGTGDIDFANPLGDISIPDPDADYLGMTNSELDTACNNLLAAVNHLDFISNTRAAVARVNDPITSLLMNFMFPSTPEEIKDQVNGALVDLNTTDIQNRIGEHTYEKLVEYWRTHRSSGGPMATMSFFGGDMVGLGPGYVEPVPGVPALVPGRAESRSAALLG